MVNSVSNAFSLNGMLFLFNSSHWNTISCHSIGSTAATPTRPSTSRVQLHFDRQCCRVDKGMPSLLHLFFLWTGGGGGGRLLWFITTFALMLLHVTLLVWFLKSCLMSGRLQERRKNGSSSGSASGGQQAQDGVDMGKVLQQLGTVKLRSIQRCVGLG